MIRVTVELISAIDGRREVIGMADICNTGQRVVGSKYGDYAVRVYRRRKGVLDPKSLYSADFKVQRAGNVWGYPRMTYNVWRLVIRALRDCFPEEK